MCDELTFSRYMLGRAQPHLIRSANCSENIPVIQRAISHGARRISLQWPLNFFKTEIEQSEIKVAIISQMISISDAIDISRTYSIEI